MMDYVEALKRVRSGNRYTVVRFVCGHDVSPDLIDQISKEDPGVVPFLELMSSRIAASLTKLHSSLTLPDNAARQFRFLRNEERRRELLALIQPEWHEDFLSFVEQGHATLGFIYYYQYDENCRRAIAEAQRITHCVLDCQYLDLKHERDLVS